jgi:hypothetical protein
MVCNYDCRDAPSKQNAQMVCNYDCRDAQSVRASKDVHTLTPLNVIDHYVHAPLRQIPKHIQ